MVSLVLLERWRDRHLGVRALEVLATKGDEVHTAAIALLDAEVLDGSAAALIPADELPTTLQLPDVRFAARDREHLQLLFIDTPTRRSGLRVWRTAPIDAYHDEPTAHPSIFRFDVTAGNDRAERRADKTPAVSVESPHDVSRPSAGQP